MKKIILLLPLLIFMIGCESKTEEFTKVCTKKIDSLYITNTEKMKVTYNNLDEVVSIVVTRTYKAKDEKGEGTIANIKKSASTFNNNLAKSDSITIKNTTNETLKYTIKYYLDVQNMNEQELDYFKIKKNSIKLLNKLKKENIKCN